MNQRRARCVLVAAWACLVGGAPAARPAERPRSASVADLIKQLAHDSFQVREDATRRLVELGEAALPAVRRAIQSDDPEVRFRAKMIYERGVRLFKEAVRAARKQMHEALASGDHTTMVKRARRVCASSEAALLDHLWLGHALQLAGDWPEAVDAYRGLVAKLKPALESSDHDVRTALARQRVALLLLIARLQSHELRDPRAAAKTCAETARMIEESTDSFLGRLRFELLKHLAACQEERGDIAAALATWKRIEQSCGPHPQAGKSDRSYDLSAVIRLMGRLPAGAPAPEMPGVTALTPKTARRTFEPARVAGKGGWWRHVVLPPAGKEFETVSIVCDFEQHTAKRPAHLYCSAFPHGRDEGRTVLRGVSWPRGAEPGRKPCAREFRLPPGSGPLRLQTASNQHHTVHRVTVTATFRPRTEGKPPAVWRPMLQVEFLPPGGKLLYDGKPFDANPRVIHLRLKPGPHVFEYTRPGGDTPFRAETRLVPGARHALFVNLDSPFRPMPTNLRGIGDLRWWMACRTSLARLKDGRWLLASCGTDQKVMLADSRDLLTWSEARPLPLNSVFHNQAPCLHVDRAGTIRLAWFSDRLSIETDTVSRKFRYRLWITRSADGRTWSPPRPIALTARAEWPVDPVQMVVGPDGRAWMFWRNQGASAESFDAIRQLRATGVPRTHWSRLDTTHVSFDPRGRMHLLFDERLDIYYCRSADGRRWSEPICLVRRPRGKVFRRGQLLFEAAGAWLICEHDDGAFLRRATPGDPPVLGQALRITHKLLPLNGMRAVRTGDGDVVLIAGADTACVLRAKLRDLASVR